LHVHDFDPASLQLEELERLFLLWALGLRFLFSLWGLVVERQDQDADVEAFF